MADRSAAAPALSATKLVATPQGWQPVCHAILGDGTLAMLAVDLDLAGEYQRIRDEADEDGSFDPASYLHELGGAGTGRIWVAGTGGWVEGPSFPLETPFPEFDRFGDGRWLVASSRSDGEAGARVLGSDGGVLGRIELGDGVRHVGIDAQDRVWVGWFDEGVFGNRRWTVAGRESPPSGDGVARLAADGTLLPLPDWPAGVGHIADCCALNVAGAGAWVCPWPDFPLVRLAPGEPVRWWRTRDCAAGAIAVAGNHALLAGWCAKEGGRLALVELGGEGVGEEARVVATWTLPFRRLPPSEDGGGRRWQWPDPLAGRGDTLHLVDDGVWHRWRVADVVALQGRSPGSGQVRGRSHPGFRSMMD